MVEPLLILLFAVACSSEPEAEFTTLLEAWLPPWAESLEYQELSAEAIGSLGSGGGWLDTGILAEGDLVAQTSGADSEWTWSLRRGSSYETGTAIVDVVFRSSAQVKVWNYTHHWPNIFSSAAQRHAACAAIG